MTSLVANNAGLLTGGRLLARNAVWNLLGSGAPMVVALFCIPSLIKALGTDRFGILALAWLVVGYFGLFDFGLGRALTKFVAEKLGTRQEQEIPVLFWTSLLLMALLGLVGTVVLTVLSPLLVGRLLKIPEAIQLETLHCFYLLALSLPVVISATGLRGFLEAQQRFGLVNAVRIPVGVFAYAGPLLALFFSRRLLTVVAVLAGGRFLSWLAYLGLCLRTAPALRHGIAWHPQLSRSLVRLGAWMTVTNVVGPLMVAFDRFLLASLISVAAVTYYATPYEIVTKLCLVPAAIVGVLFPAFSTSFAQDQERTEQLMDRGVKSTVLALFPIVLLIVTFAQDGLQLWLGPEFGLNGTRVLQCLAVGVFLNSAAQVPFSLVQGAGRPDLTAKLHVAEVPVYALVLWWLIRSHGIEGAAIAWTARVAIDTLALFMMSKNLLPTSGPTVRRHVVMLAAATLSLVCATFVVGAVEKWLFLVATLLAFAMTCWFIVLTPQDRDIVRSCLETSHAPN